MAGASTIAIAAIGAFSQVDSRYVHSDDMDQYKKHVATVIVTQAADSRRKTIEDRLFELDTKRGESSLTPIESAQYMRFERELRSLATTSNSDLVANLDKRADYAANAFDAASSSKSNPVASVSDAPK